MKFKVGDRVRAIQPIDGLDMYGMIGTIVEIRENESIVVDFDKEFDSAWQLRVNDIRHYNCRETGSNWQGCYELFDNKIKQINFIISLLT